MSPSISVVIPVFNGADDLERCLTALSSSSLEPLECFEVDDGCTDLSAEIAARHGEKVLSTGGLFGPAAARNLGVRAVSGDVILFVVLDCSDYSGTLSQISDEFAKDPG